MREAVARGWSRDAIIRRFGTAWSMARRSVRRDLEAVHKEMAADYTDDQRHVFRAQALERLEEVFRRALDKGDYSPAVRALDTMARIQGVYAPTEHRVDLGGQVAVNQSMTSAERRARVKELLDRGGVRIVPAADDAIEVVQGATEAGPANGANGHGGNGTAA